VGAALGRTAPRLDLAVRNSTLQQGCPLGINLHAAKGYGEERAAGRGRAVEGAAPSGAGPGAVVATAGLRGGWIGERRQGGDGEDQSETGDSNEIQQLHASSFQGGRIA